MWGGHFYFEPIYAPSAGVVEYADCTNAKG